MRDYTYQAQTHGIPPLIKGVEPIGAANIIKLGFVGAGACAIALGAILGLGIVLDNHKEANRRALVDALNEYDKQPIERN